MQIRVLISFIFACLATSLGGQTFTFQCMCQQVTGDTCDICPTNPAMESRSFSGLLVYRNGQPYKWIDAPYMVKRFQNGSAEFIEQIPNPEKITVGLWQTPYGSMSEFISKSDCNCGDAGFGDGIDTVANYTEIRNYAGLAKVLYVQDFSYRIGSDTYTVRGGLFRRVKTGTDNGATILTGVYKWKRAIEYPVLPEWFTGMKHHARLTAAFALAGNGGKVACEPNYVYELQGRPYIDSLQHLTIDGRGSTWKRCPSSKSVTTLTAAYSGGYTLQVAAIPESWEVGDILVLATGVDNDHTSGRTRITNISGTTVSIQYIISAQATGAPVFNAPIGANVLEDFFLLAGRPSATEGVYGVQGANRGTVIENITFDGNRANNTVCLSWPVNSAYLLNGVGSEIRHCYFVNHPNEIGGGFGLNIHHNVFEMNNGSVFHISGNDATINHTIYNFFNNNIVRNVNLVSRDTSGHNEGAISFSWNGGNTVIQSNYFENGNHQALCGTLTGSGTANDREDFVFSNNTCRNFPAGIIYALDGSSEGAIISDNILQDCGTNDYTPYGANKLKVCGNLLKGSTTLVVPSAIGCQTQGDILGSGTTDQVLRWNGTTWAASDDKWTNSATGGHIYRPSNVGIGVGSELSQPGLQLAVGGGLGIVDNTGGSPMTPTTGTLLGIGKYGAMPANHQGAHIYITNSGNVAGTGEAFGSLVLQPATNGASKSVIIATGNGTPTAKIVATQTGITMPTNAGVGNDIAYFDNGGGILRSGLDISTIPTVNGFATAIPYHTGPTTLGTSTSLTWHGTGMSVGHTSTPEQMLDIASAMQIRFPAVNPNTVNGAVFLGIANAVRSSANVGAAIGYTGAYGVVASRPFGTFFIQGRSDGLSGISLLTGSGGIERLYISESGPVEIADRLNVGSLTGTATNIGGWTSGGQATTVTLGSGLSLSSGTLTSTGLGGTVTSVGLSMPSIFNVSGSPVSGSGTLTATLANQSANTVFAGPVSGGASAPTFRSLVAADITTGGGIAGSGTANYHAKFTGASTIGNSLIYDNGTNVGVGTTTLNAFFTLSKSTGVSSNRFLEFADPAGYGSVWINRFNASGTTQRGIRFGSDVGGYITSSTDSLLVIDGYNKSVGINCMNPVYPHLLQINGVADTRGVMLERSATARSRWRINSEGDVVFSSSTGFFAFADEAGTSGNLSSYNPSASLHLFAPAGVGANGLFRLEKAGGYGATLFEQYYTNGSVYGAYIGDGTTRILNISEGVTKGLGVTGVFSVSSLSGTATNIGGWTSGGQATTVTLGSGLSLSSGTISATGPSGSGTTNTVSKWTSSTALGNSSITDDGTTVTTTSNLRVNAPGALMAEFTHGTQNAVSASVRNSATVASTKSASISIAIGAALGGANGRYYDLITQGQSSTTADFIIKYWNGSSALTRATFASDGTANFNNANGNLGLNTLGYFDLPTFATDPSATGYGKLWYNYTEGVNRVMLKASAATLRQVITDQDDLIGTTVTKTANFTLAANEMYVVADANAGAFTATFGAAMMEGRTYVLECRRNGTNTITVDADTGYNLVADTFSSFPDDGAIACGGAGTGFQAPHKTYILRRFGTNIIIQ